MGWRTLVVNSHAKLSYKNNYLVYTSSDKRELIHLSEIDVLILESTQITITNMLIKRLVDEKVSVIFCDDKRLPNSILMPLYARYDSSLQIRKQIEWNEDLKTRVSTEIINQKLYNQAKFLKILGYDIKSNRISEIRSELEPYDPTNREAHGARIYFNTLFGHKFSRDDDTDINAALDYGYSVILALISREILVNGCITQLGLNHTNQFNDYNLASDLMEPFRIIIDRIVYENKTEKFNKIKMVIFDIFNQTYLYQENQMYLTNIVKDYVRRIIKILNGELLEIPEFKL